MCFDVHLSPSIQFPIPGPAFAVSIVLDPQIGLYTDLIQNNYLDAGFVLRPIADSRQLYTDNDIALSPGMHTYVALKETTRRLVRHTTPIIGDVLRFFGLHESPPPCNTTLGAEWIDGSNGIAYKTKY